MPSSNTSFLYTSDPGLILGFHGCDEYVRNAVVSGGAMLKESKKAYEWLGHGIYFWQNNYERALDFATEPPDGKEIKKPSVLGAVLSLGNCLDLTDTKYIKSLEISFNSFKKSAVSENTTLPKNTSSKGAKDVNDRALRKLDCAVIENIHKELQAAGVYPFDSVRGVFVEGDPVYQEAGFHEKTHIQICIRNPNCIKGFFIPRQEAKWPA